MKKIGRLPYLSARMGSHRSVQHHPIKREAPIIPTTQSAVQVKSSLCYQLFRYFGSAGSGSKEKTVESSAQIYFSVQDVVTPAASVQR